MSRLNDIFARLRDEGRAALMPFVTGGHPTMATTTQVLPALQRAGASIVEIGFPFSDPIADGPVIAESMHEALEAGATPAGIFKLVREQRATLDIGLVAMVSESIVQRIGPGRFVNDAADAGFDGLIVPDVDLDDAVELRGLADERDLGFSLLVAPTTSRSRLPEVVGLCSGFVYLLARAGITGETDEVPDIRDGVEAIRAVTDLPVAVGFGISRPDHVAAVTATADAAIVGSALVRRMSSAEDPVAAAARLVGELATGLRRG